MQLTHLFGYLDGQSSQVVRATAHLPFFPLQLSSMVAVDVEYDNVRWLYSMVHGSVCMNDGFLPRIHPPIKWVVFAGALVSPLDSLDSSFRLSVVRSSYYLPGPSMLRCIRNTKYNRRNTI